MALRPWDCPQPETPPETPPETINNPRQRSTYLLLAESGVQQVRGISADEVHAAVVARLVALRQVTLELSGVR